MFSELQREPSEEFQNLYRMSLTDFEYLLQNRILTGENGI
jgi:hypothetical protein